MRDRSPIRYSLRQAIKMALEAAVYSATERRYHEKLLHIAQKNQVLARYPHTSFSYKGEYYNFEMQPLRYKNQRLLEDLHPVMDECWADQQHIEYYERPFIFGLFNRVLNASNSVDDYLLLLPASVHQAIHGLQLKPEYLLPRQLTDEQVEEFKTANADWLLMLKKRMVLDLVTT